MVLKLEKNTINLIKSLGFKSNEVGSVLFIIIALNDGEINLLDEFDEETSDKSALLLYKNLEVRGILEKDKREDKISTYMLTFQGQELADTLCKCDSSPIVVPCKEEDLNEWVETWRELWKDDRGVSYRWDNRALLGSQRDTFIKMQRFLADYNYLFKKLPEGLTPRGAIIGATEAYLNQHKKVAFYMCKTSNNFISKQEGKTRDTIQSILALEVENFIAMYKATNGQGGKVIPKKKPFSRSV